MSNTAKHTLPTTVVAFNLDLAKPEQAKRYSAIVAKMKGRRCFSVYGSEKSTYTASAGKTKIHLVLIETAFIFDNQWNTETARVFDWFEDQHATDRGRRVGHYVELTPDLVAIREQTHKCGYCGQHYGPYHAPLPEKGFCLACLSGDHIKREDLPLLRVRSLAAKDRPKRTGSLSPAEADYLLPLFEAGRERMLARQTAALVAREEKRLRQAKMEHEGMLWLLEHGVDIGKVIYYRHKGTDGVFQFGWGRYVLTDDERSRALDVISEFPHDYAGLETPQ